MIAYIDLAYRFIGLGELVYSVVWGTLLTECVEEETCRLSEEEVDRKTPTTPPVKIADFITGTAQGSRAWRGGCFNNYKSY